MRVRMVTRTVIENKLNVLGMNLSTGEPVKIELVCGIDFPKGETDQLKFVRKKHENSELAIAKILSVETCETIYGMTEDQFLKVAKPMTDDRKFMD